MSSSFLGLHTATSRLVHLHLRRRSLGAVLCALVIVGAVASAQTRKPVATLPDPKPVKSLEEDSIRCWWRTDQTAIVVGEQFKLTLTCGVLEAEGVSVTPNRESLEPGSLQLTPFEVVSGRKHEDVVALPWRYFQYVYDVRLLGTEFFGRDLNLPSIGITYRVVVKASETEGRERTYLLPPLPMRLISLVPREASDIRDDWSTTFAAIEDRRVRATGEMVAGSISLGFAVVLFGAGFVRSLVKSRASKARVAPTAPVGAILRGSAATLREVRKEVSRDGWTPERVTQALSALRVAAAVALGRPVAQIRVEPDVPAREGQVLVKSGLLRPLRMAVSAPTGARAVESRTARPGKPPARWKRLDLIGDAIRVFSKARYSRNETLDTGALDAALERAEQALSRLWIRYSWPARSSGRLVKPAATGGAAWFR